MTTLIVLRGNSGSGKSTLARALTTTLGADNTLLLQQDVIRRTILHADDHPGTPAVACLQELLLAAQGWVPFVVTEGILRRDVYGPMLATVSRQYGPAVHSFYLAVPFAVTWQRNLAKSQPFSRASLRRWWRDADDLPGDIRLPDQPLDASLQTVLEAIHHE